MTRDADSEELGSLAPLARLLPREVAPPPNLWERIAARLEPRGGLDDLAASLPTQVDPPKDLWPGIEARLRRAANAPLPVPVRITAVPERRSLKPRISFTIPQLAAACLALVVLSAAGAFYIGRGSRKAETASIAQLPAPAAATMVESQDAIKDVERLRELLASRRNDLNPATVAALETSLRTIDSAIRQAQLALAADPKNPYLRDHLDDTMRRKVDLMRRATMLASAD